MKRWENLGSEFLGVGSLFVAVPFGVGTLPFAHRRRALSNRGLALSVFEVAGGGSSTGLDQRMTSAFVAVFAPGTNPLPAGPAVGLRHSRPGNRYVVCRDFGNGLSLGKEVGDDRFGYWVDVLCPEGSGLMYG